MPTGPSTSSKAAISRKRRTPLSAVGDDNLERRIQGYVAPDSFSHGTSEQRVRWFRKGYETGDTNQGDTFSASEL